MDLTTNYLGLKLRSPLVPSASPLSEEWTISGAWRTGARRRWCLHSLFEEQLRQDRLELQQKS